MITLISFILVLIGCMNWLAIGFFQFDFVAGIFGTQANVFSRIIYILVGVAAVWLTYAVIRYKGRLTLKGGAEQDKRMLGIKEIEFANSQESAQELTHKKSNQQNSQENNRVQNSKKTSNNQNSKNN